MGRTVEQVLPKDLEALLRDVRLPYVVIREERPRFSDRVDVVLDRDRWKLLANFRPRHVATWTIHNRGSQVVNYSTVENDPFPNQIDPGEKTSFNTDPEAVWGQRTTSASSPPVHLEYWWWDD